MQQVIEVNQVSMRYEMVNDRIQSAKEYLIRMAQRRISRKEFWALRDVSFTMERGDVMGIVGSNGAGKSTLLKIIAGILKPTSGTVKTYGNIVPMLELGSGFDMDMTGRENVFLNGAILGYSKEYLEDKYKQILDFSELGDFIDVPIRNYSSGMVMRLAFSIATTVHPEIMIVDEIMAVGDTAFQHKSKAKMMELMGNGTSVLFVSHDLRQVESICRHAIWLEHGAVRDIGTASEICAAYRQSLEKGEG